MRVETSLLSAGQGVNYSTNNLLKLKEGFLHFFFHVEGNDNDDDASCLPSSMVNVTNSSTSSSSMMPTVAVQCVSSELDSFSPGMSPAGKHICVVLGQPRGFTRWHSLLLSPVRQELSGRYLMRCSREAPVSLWGSQTKTRDTPSWRDTGQFVWWKVFQIFGIFQDWKA